MPDQTEKTMDALNSLLRGEIAAAETYGQALRRADPGTPLAQGLTGLRDRHVEAANLLRRFVADRGAKAATSSGPWGTYAKAVTGTATLLGDTAAVVALREGEEHGEKEYEKILQYEDLDSQARGVIEATLLPEQRRHAREVERLLRVT